MSASLLHPTTNSTLTYQNLPYDDVSPNCVLDLHLPNNGYTQRPLIVWLHMGGWMYGDENSQVIPKDKGFVQKGFAVASVRYRLDSEAIWPAQLRDVKAAIRYLRAHAGVWGLYAPKMGVWGASAGGHLAAMCATTNGVAKFDVGNYLHTSSAVAICMDDYGPTDLASWAAGPYTGPSPSPATLVTNLLGTPAAQVPDLAADASPLHWVSPATTCPIGCLHGGADTLVPVPQSQALSSAVLSALGSSSSWVVSPPGKGHADMSMYTTDWCNGVAALFDGFLRP